jgi:lipopolysaccharide transport system ATP-binding protein
VVECRGVVKRFHLYEHRTTSLRELFVRGVLRRPIHVRRAKFHVTGFDLEVRAGEAVALVGANGSGKSTVLRLLAGIYAPTEGVIRTRGRVTAVIELGAAFHPELTGAENVALSAAAIGLRGREITRLSPEIIAFADIGDFIDVPLKYYSSGMQARLAFAVATCVEPDILLLDEVLAVGDQSFRERCLDRLRGFHARGGTMLMVSHDLATIRDLCSRAVWLEHGRVRMAGEIDEVLDAYQSSGA